MFLFTFHQATGKRRALHDGPWIFGKDLVVMVDFDESEILEELSFVFILVWVRVSKLPFGMMNNKVGEAIGGELGEFMEMEKKEDGSAVGHFLRIKVRLDIRKPLMCGVLVHDERKEEASRPIWCPVVYEYLPDFCYTCGLIGHIDKVCEKKLQKGEVQQYSKAFRFIPERRRVEEGSRLHWRSGGSGSRDNWGLGGRPRLTGARSDAPSWRKPEEGGVGTKGAGLREEEEVTSPKRPKGKSVEEGEKAKRVLLLERTDVRQSAEVRETEQINVNSGMHHMHVDQTEGLLEGKEKEKEGEKGESRKRGVFKRQPRVAGEKVSSNQSKEVGRKRSSSDVCMVGKELCEAAGESELETQTNKRAKKAGLAD
jgi:hypothetical protein